jgi:pimeloyl-ACP methyl ester carboxylesterase
VARSLSRRAVFARSGGAETVLPPDGAEYRAYEAAINTDAVSALFAKVGQGILVTHSQSGTLGWLTAIKSPNVRAIVSYEPGGTFVFPEGETPAPMTHVGGTLTPTTVPRADFLKLTRIPIVVYYGGQYPRAAQRQSGAGPVAHLPCDGAAVAGTPSIATGVT